MKRELSPVRALGYLVLSVEAIALAGSALIAAVSPAGQINLMRWMLLMFIFSGIVMTVAWVGFALTSLVVHILQDPQ